jgi:hypothetical protein
MDFIEEDLLYDKLEIKHKLTTALQKCWGCAPQLKN